MDRWLSGNEPAISTSAKITAFGLKLWIISKRATSKKMFMNLNDIAYDEGKTFIV